MRVGPWKLVAKHNGAWELYNIDADRVESTNLAAREPERVRDMTARYASWAARAQVEPWPVNPAKKKN